ncbi:putative LRR containing protein [Trachipleistophora hominis]|uniref:Putative LRR containing protein n=1 Tax=Trachipleistophora hominis TaxID=72359 RepID=L7JRE2_TRAHO|nr:putative LRR containing protein [Trachipleistophora hominis]
MLFNLYDYVNVAVIYVLVFEPNLDEENVTSIEVYNLNDTKIRQFFKCAEIKSSRTSYDDVRHHSKEHTAQIFKQQGTSSQFNTPFSLEKTEETELSQSTGSNIMPAKGVTAQKYVYKMPFSFKLYERAILKKNGDPYRFSANDIHCIFKYIFIHIEYDKWLTYAILRSLQDEPSIFFCLSESSREYKLNMLRIRPNNVNKPHNFDEALFKFRASVNYNIAVCLTVDGREIATVGGKNRNENTIQHEISLPDLKIGFIFEQLEVHIDNFKKYINLFYKKFRYNGYNSKLTIIISGNLSFNTMLDVMVNKTVPDNAFEWLLEHKILHEEELEQVALKMTAANVSPDTLTNNIFPRNVYLIQCSICLLNRNGPPIQDIGINFMRYLYPDINDILQDITRLYCQNITINENFYVKKRFKYIQWRDSMIEEGFTVTFEVECETLDIKRTTGLFNLAGMMGLYQVWLTVIESSLCFSVDNQKATSCLTLKHVQITDNITIDSRTTQITFEHVESDFNIALEITDNHKLINIRRSIGEYEFKGNLKLRSRFNVNTILTIKSDKVYRTKFFLMNCDFNVSATLSKIYGCVELRNILIGKDFCFKVNENCEKLMILQCTGLFDLSNVDRLEILEINFSNQWTKKLRIIGPISVKHLTLINLPKDLIILTQFFNELVSIQCLTIGCSSLRLLATNLETYFCSINLKSICQKYQHYTNTATAENAQTSEKEHPTLTSCKFLSVIFHAPALVEVERLEYQKIYMSNHNCEYLLSLRKLKMLKVYMENLGNETFIYLPQNIEYLNIQASLFTDYYLKSPPNSLRELSNLKVFVVSGNVFFNLTISNYLPPSLNVLVVSYFLLKNNFSGDSNIVKIRPCRLYISALQDLIIDIETGLPHSDVHNFLDALFNYVEREHLELLVLATTSSCYEIDVLTFRTVNHFPKKFDFGIGNN